MINKEEDKHIGKVAWDCWIDWEEFFRCFPVDEKVTSLADGYELDKHIRREECAKGKDGCGGSFEQAVLASWNVE